MGTGEERYISAFDKDFPEKLKNIPMPPAGIYVKGALPNPEIPSVAIIGAREASAYGISVARYFSRELSKAGIQIISGMARGIDGTAQREAILSGGFSFGVLGCGTDIIYPRENADIFKKILDAGGLISEYPVGTAPKKLRFPARNRIISALSDCILVVEAREKSGTKITVSHALEQGKDILAVPGRIYDPLSRGCNSLIADGAAPALSPESVLEVLGIFRDKGRTKDSLNKNLEEKLSSEERDVLHCLDFDPKGLEEIINDRKLKDVARERIISILLKLQLLGLVNEIGRQKYHLTDKILK